MEEGNDNDSKEWMKKRAEGEGGGHLLLQLLNGLHVCTIVREQPFKSWSGIYIKGEKVPYLKVNGDVGVCQPACLSVGLSVCLSVYLSVCLSGWLSVCLSVCLPV
jgi:hypothetical protein